MGTPAETVTVTPAPTYTTTPCETTLPETYTVTPAPTYTTTPAETVTQTPAPTYTPAPESPCGTVAPAPAPESPCETVAPAPAPESPCGTVAPAPAPTSPCGTVAPTYKKYASQESPVVKKDSSTQTWAFPLIGAVAMISCISLAVGLRKKNSRSTRQMSLVSPVSLESDLEMEIE